MSERVDIAEYILTATLPGSVMYDSGQSDFAIQDAGLACAGMPKHWYLALLFRVLGDRKAMAELWSRLYAIAASSPRKAARKRAGLLASLVLAEDSGAGIVEKIGLIPALLRISRSQYYRDVRPLHLDLRARLDSWARGGTEHIVRRCR
jgi:hypothetical protein